VALQLELPALVWKALVGEPCSLRDLEAFDHSAYGMMTQIGRLAKAAAAAPPPMTPSPKVRLSLTALYPKVRRHWTPSLHCITTTLTEPPT
jgi:hypothetical protein